MKPTRTIQLALFGAAILLGFTPAAMLSQVIADENVQVVLSATANLLVRGGVIAAIAIALVNTRQTNRKRTWGTLLAALLFDFAAAGSFMFVRLGGETVTGPIISPLGDSLQLSAYVFVLLALYSMRSGGRQLTDWRLPILDGTTAVLAISSIIWLLVINRETPDASDAGIGNFVLQLGYPLLDVAMLTMLIVVGLRPSVECRGSMLRGISGFVLFIFIGDGFIGTALYLSKTAQTTLLGAASISQGLALASLFFATQSKDAKSNGSEQPVESTEFQSVWAASALSVVGLYIVALFILIGRSGIEPGRVTIELVLLISMSVIGLVFVIRQAIVIRQTRRVLEAQVAARTHELELARIELARSHRSLRSLTEHAPMGIAARSAGGTIEYTNAQWDRFVELCPALRNWAPEDTGGYDYLRDLVLEDTSGKKHFFYATIADYIDQQGGSGGVWLIVTEVTERKLQETQVFNLSKLASLGEMSTGLAHELNQPLQGMRLTLANLNRMLSRPQPDLTEAQAKLQRLNDMVQRAGNLVHKMRAFGRVEAADIEAVDLRQSIAEAIELCRSELTNHDIQLNTHLPDQPAMVMGVGQMVEQVIVNGLLNARDALRDQAGKAAVSIVLEQEGECWQVRIIDNGPGIPEEIIDRVMEPFFTTKPVNEGTGLGLSLSYGMITGMNGDLEITNIEGGVELRLSLPAAVS